MLGGKYLEKEVVITSAVRTAIGKFEGSFRTTPAVKIGAYAIEDALKRSKVQPELVDEVIMGNVISAGLGQNPARQAMLYAGLPVEAGALTINKSVSKCALFGLFVLMYATRQPINHAHHGGATTTATVTTITF